MSEQKEISKKQPKSKIGWLLAAIGIGGGFLAYKGTQLKAWYDALDINFTGRITGYQDGNFILKCQAILDNPKKTSITITKPTIRIYTGDTLVARSEPSSQKVEIKGNSITYINYELKVPALSGVLFRLLTQVGVSVANIISQLISGTLEELSLGVDLTSKTFMQVYGIEHVWEETFTI